MVCNTTRTQLRTARRANCKGSLRKECIQYSGHIHATNTEDTSIVCYLFEANQQNESISEEYFLTKVISSLLKNDSQLCDLLHSSPPPAFLFDFSLSTPDADTITKATLLTGKRGVVMLLFSAEASALGAMFLQEQEVLGQLNLLSMQVRRVFLKLIPMGPLLLAFMDAIAHGVLTQLWLGLLSVNKLEQREIA